MLSYVGVDGVFVGVGRMGDWLEGPEDVLVGGRMGRYGGKISKKIKKLGGFFFFSVKKIKFSEKFLGG